MRDRHPLGRPDRSLSSVRESRLHYRGEYTCRFGNNINVMNIKVCKTTEWSESIWNTYVFAYNEVFRKTFPKEHFDHKYLHSNEGYSYHALLIDTFEEVVGGCTVIPCRYKRYDEEVMVGLAVDVFIRETHRTDPLMLRRMYSELKKSLEGKGIMAVIAVPNAVAYPYWKAVVKWKDIGSINYWMLPVRAGRILGKQGFVGKMLNTLSLAYTSFVRIFSEICLPFGGKTKTYRYSICEDDPYYVHKFYGQEYHRIETGHIRIIYRIVNEDGIKTGYLLTAEENGMRTFKSFRKAVLALLSHRVDMILYIGQIGFFQTLLLKVPKRFEPKRLPITCDLISCNERYKDMFDMRNWDFGLKNYDVR